MSFEKIHVMFVLEMIGRPPEHLTYSMNEIIKNIQNLDGVEIKKKKIFEPKKIEGEKNLYSMFVEIEALFENIEILTEVLFTYIPSHFEIIEPEEMRIKNVEITDMITKIIQRLHQVDEIAKVLTMEKTILQNKLAEYEGKFKSEIPEPKKRKKLGKKEK